MVYLAVANKFSALRTLFAIALGLLDKFFLLTQGLVLLKNPLQTNIWSFHDDHSVIWLSLQIFGLPRFLMIMVLLCNIEYENKVLSLFAQPLRLNGFSVLLYEMVYSKTAENAILMSVSTWLEDWVIIQLRGCNACAFWLMSLVALAQGHNGAFWQDFIRWQFRVFEF